MRYHKLAVTSSLQNMAENALVVEPDAAENSVNSIECAETTHGENGEVCKLYTELAYINTSDRFLLLMK